MLNTLTMNRYKKWMRSQCSTSSTCQNGMEPGRRIHALLGITNYQCIHHLEKHLSQRLMFSCRKMTPQSWRWTSPPPLTPILEALFWKRLITSLFQPGACHRQLMTVTSFVVAWNRHLLAALSRSSFHPKSAAVSGFSSAVSSRQLIFHSSRITRSSRRHLRPQDLIIFWWPPKSYMSSDVIGSRSYAARIQVNKEKNSRQVSCCVYRDDGSENNRYTPPTSDTDTKRDTLFGRD